MPSLSPLPLPSAPVRNSFRRYVRLPCEVVREHDFKVIGDLALDLSTEGMLERATRRVLTGEEVVVAFQAPRSHVWFDALGIVARVIHGRRPGDSGVCLGVEFYGMSRLMKRDLFEQLRGLEGPEASRPLRSLISA
jgi:hypothetical protein